MKSATAETFNTDLSLPNESMLFWLKYSPSIKFDRIVISYEDRIDAILDIQFKNMLKEIMVKLQGEKRTINLSRSELSLDGFIGFVTKYSKIPDTETQLSFIIELISNSELVQSTELTTKIVRPLLEMVNPHNYNLDINSNTPDELEAIKLYIHNKGNADAKNIILKIESSNKSIQARLNYTERVKEVYEFFRKTTRQRDLILEVQGIGQGIIRFFAEYTDELGNFYRSDLLNVPVIAEYNKITKIPIGPVIEQHTLNGSS